MEGAAESFMMPDLRRERRRRRKFIGLMDGGGGGEDFGDAYPGPGAENPAFRRSRQTNQSQRKPVAWFWHPFTWLRIPPLDIFIY